MSELYKKYRPANFGRVVGHGPSVTMLNQAVSSGTVPHAILFTGPSGTGKTTLARIVAKALGATGPDLREVNCADFRGIDMVREMRQASTLAPLHGKARVWIIDECHKLSNDAQNAMLKLLEDTPGHAYFFLATTEPNKLIKTIQTRCTPITLEPIDKGELRKLVRGVAKAEQASVTEAVELRLLECAEGSARQLLVLLDKVLRIDGEDAQLSALESFEANKEAIDLARALCNPKVQWGEVARMLKEIKDEPESVRRCVLGYARAILLSPNAQNKGLAAGLIEAFRDHFYDCGAAGLALACFEIKGRKQ